MSDLWSVWVPTWLSAVGTVGAFSTGGVILLRELRRDREREIQAMRERAGVFSVWPVREESRSAGVPVLESRLVLSNAGAEPVYDVVVEYERSGEALMRDAIGMVPPGQLVRNVPRELNEVWVRAGSAWRRQGRPEDPVVDDPLRQPWTFRIGAHFADAAGRRWRRDHDGSITLRQ